MTDQQQPSLPETAESTAAGQPSALPLYGQTDGPPLAGAQPFGTQPYVSAPAPVQPSGGSGFAITSLILGIVGVLFGLIPLTFWVAGTLGVIGLVLGLVGFGRARRQGRAKGLPIAGTVLSTLALILSVVGAVIVVNAVDELGDNLENLGRTPAATAAATSVAPTDTAPVDDPATTSAAPADETYAIGETAAWEDGVTAVVKSVRPASFGASATTPGPGVKVTVTITNGSDAALDLFPTADIRLGTEGRNAEQVYATGCDGLSDLGRLAPGRTVTGTMCFAGRGVTVDVSFAPTFEHNALTWTGRPA